VTDGKAKLEGVARLAEQAQPKGSTLDSAGVHTPVSSVLALKAASKVSSISNVALLNVNRCLSADQKSSEACDLSTVSSS